MNNPTVNTTTPNNLTTLLVQNPDLLLSCASIEDRGLQHHHLSHLDPNNETNSSNNNHMTTMTSSSNPSELIIPDVVVEMDAATATASCPIRQFSFDQFIQQEEVSLEQQQEIKEEILDFNIFDLLQNEEPEMARLIDQASSSFDTILGSPSSFNYLPQISVNTTTKVLDNLVAAHHHHMGMPKTLSNSSLSSMLLELSRASGNEIDLSSNGQKQAPVLFKLDDEMPSTSGGSMHPSSSFKELCDLLSISKQKTTTTLTKLKLTDDTLPSTSSAASLKPSRSSMRLIQKRGIKKEPMDVEEETPKRRNTSTTSRRNSKKLPYSDSEDSDDKSSTTDSPSDSPKPATNLNSSNENSMDLSTFYTPNDQSDEDEDDDDDIESDDSSSMGGVMKRSSARSGRKNGLHPIKKESNKEAATRYRLKKISEKDKLFETRFNLEKENDSKRRQIELVQTEINYLKTILVQFILTKSCITNNNNTNNPTAV